MLIRALLLSLGGFLLVQLALRPARKAGLFTAAFWQTFSEFAPYRVKRLWPIAPGVAGIILLIWGLIFLFDWILAYYAARLGHPLT